MSLHSKVERLDDRVKPEPSRKSPEARARMSAGLDEIAAARREGRAPSREAAPYPRTGIEPWLRYSSMGVVNTQEICSMVLIW